MSIRTPTRYGRSKGDRSVRKGERERNRTLEIEGPAECGAAACQQPCRSAAGHGSAARSRRQRRQRFRCCALEVSNGHGAFDASAAVRGRTWSAGPFESANRECHHERFAGAAFRVARSSAVHHCFGGPARGVRWRNACKGETSSAPRKFVPCPDWIGTKFRNCGPAVLVGKHRAQKIGSLCHFKPTVDSAGKVFPPRAARRDHGREQAKDHEEPHAKEAVHAQSIEGPISFRL